MAGSGGLRVGSLFGIGIEVNWFTVLMILFFGIISPYLGFIWFLLFACVLMHELAHSIAAKRNGVRVSRIVLLPFGGVSVIENLRIDPRIEFNISIVGPLMSLFLGGAFGLVDLIMPMGFFRALFQELFVLNVFLGVFNIVPAFPMDGGRIFRSYLQRKMDLYSATMATAKLTRAILALIVIGTLCFVLFWTGYSLLYREYVLLIDFVVVLFIYDGLRAEEGAVTLRRNTRGLAAGDAVSAHFVYVEPETGVGKLYDMVRRSGEHIVITRMGKEYAIVNLAGRKGGADATAASLAEYIPRIDTSASLADTMGAISSGAQGIAAVESHGKLKGIVTMAQLQTLITLHLMKGEHRKEFKG